MGVDVGTAVGGAGADTDATAVILVVLGADVVLPPANPVSDLGSAIIGKTVFPRTGNTTCLGEDTGTGALVLAWLALGVRAPLAGARLIACAGLTPKFVVLTTDAVGTRVLLPVVAVL